MLLERSKKVLVPSVRGMQNVRKALEATIFLAHPPTTFLNKIEYYLSSFKCFFQVFYNIFDVVFS